MGEKRLPQVRNSFSTTTRLTDNLPRVKPWRRSWAAWRHWSCNAKANVPRKTLEILKEQWLRLFLVGMSPAISRY